jgi:anti-sigma28 factor (negative regulator of flagellin synthesis)
MRLHLDPGSIANNATNNAIATENAATTSKAAQSFGTSRARGVISGGGSHDSVAVSGASSAFSASFADRAFRVAQLTAAYQNGSYHISSAAVSQSIVAGATGGAGAMVGAGTTT